MAARSLTAALCAGTLAIAGCGSSNSSSTSSAATNPATNSATSSTATSASSQSTTSSQTSAQNSAGSLGPEGIPLEQGPQLAPASTTSTSRSVDGSKCAPIEQLAYHIHAHFQVYVDGQPRSLPAAIGMLGPVFEATPYGRFYGATVCYYYLHTHASDGVIHIESPTVRIYTLGDFFDEWSQQLTPNQVGPAKGKITAFLNGKRWTQSPRAIPLAAHNVIQLDVGKPVVPFKAVSFKGTGL
jgi:hypothetical protein